MGYFLTLFTAGLLTILLPCILPLLPIVLSASMAGRSRWIPLTTVAGMAASFVVFTFSLLTALSHFSSMADYIRVGSYYLLFLLGAAFLSPSIRLRLGAVFLGSLFFIGKGLPAVFVACLIGAVAILLSGRMTYRLQQAGVKAQAEATAAFGRESHLTAFIIGATMGLVWVPCAGPALGFVLTLVREQPGLDAIAGLAAYAAGAGGPLLVIGYGGQAAAGIVRSATRYAGLVKRLSGTLLILTAVGLHSHWFTSAGAALTDVTGYGETAASIESKLFHAYLSSRRGVVSHAPVASLPSLRVAPEFRGLVSWLNSPPLTLGSLRGRVVLVDFWTYSCINCIRTLPHIEEYWRSYKNLPFTVIGIHTPEFVFEKDPGNVVSAVRRFGLTYPIAQDNEYETWKAFENRYWPAKYLIDARGVVRYTHFGEGAYAETDRAIRILLREAGADVPPDEDVSQENDLGGSVREISPETYLGERGLGSLGNAHASALGSLEYKAPASSKKNAYYLEGTWELIGGERQVLRSGEGEIRMRFAGSECNVVLGMEEGFAPAKVEVEVDGNVVGNFSVNRHDMFRLFLGSYGDHDLAIKIKGAGIGAYAFTFG